MSHNLSEDPIFKKLLFTKDWIEAGIINSENFVKYKNRYLEEEDTCTEHYRYGAFKDFIRNNQNISKETFYAIYNLGKKDPDPCMGKSMIINIVQCVDCPKELINMAIENKNTSKTVLKLQKKGRVQLTCE